MVYTAGISCTYSIQIDTIQFTDLRVWNWKARYYTIVDVLLDGTFFEFFRSIQFGCCGDHSGAY